MTIMLIWWGGGGVVGGDVVAWCAPPNSAARGISRSTGVQRYRLADKGVDNSKVMLTFGSTLIK